MSLGKGPRALPTCPSCPQPAHLQPSAVNNRAWIALSFGLGCCRQAGEGLSPA